MPPSAASIGVKPTRLRQIALVAKDLDKARHLLTRVIGTEVIYEDPLVAQWGLKNFLIAIGGDIIEVVSPFKPNTTAGRLLSKRGDGGYMIIMQTMDAAARKKHIQENKLGKVIFDHEADGRESICVQYHPKGVPGGVLPELDSHTPSTTNPEPVVTRFSPWHACGPESNYNTYSSGMRRNGDLHLLDATLRLAPGETDTQKAALQWETIFGVQKNKESIEFTNAKIGFIKGEEGKVDGIVNVTIGVEGERRLTEIIWRAKFQGIALNESGCLDMLGVEWRFVLVDEERQISRL